MLEGMGGTDGFLLLSSPKYPTSLLEAQVGVDAAEGVFE